MAAIPATSMGGSGARAVSKITLGSSDTLTFNPSKDPVLVLDNVTGGALTPKIDGAGGTTVPVAGVGSVDVSGGYDVPVAMAAGVINAIPLKSISGFLQGVVTITNGSGIKAYILEF
jgi:hypothetical protein